MGNTWVGRETSYTTAILIVSSGMRMDRAVKKYNGDEVVVLLARKRRASLAANERTDGSGTEDGQQPRYPRDKKKARTNRQPHGIEPATVSLPGGATP
jgi:hypothetical protein